MTPSLLDYMPPSIHSRRSQVLTEYAPKHTSEYVLKYTPGHALKDARRCARWHTHSMLDYTLPSKSSRRTQVHSEYAPNYTEYILKHTPGHDLKDAPNCIRWHTPSLVYCTLPRKLSICSEAHSRERSQVHSQLHSMTHSLPAWLYAPKYTLKRQDTPKLT
jgi:hypothetical protein